MVQYLQINQYDTEHSKNKLNISNKEFYQIQHPFMIKKIVIKVVCVCVCVCVWMYIYITQP